MLDYWITEENSIEKFQFLWALFEGIDWKNLFDKKATKENQDLAKIAFLVKKIKSLSNKENFIDYFPLAFIRNSNFDILKQSLEKLLATLKMNLP